MVEVRTSTSCNQETPNCRVFLSYTRANTARVEAIAGYLEGLGFEVFWDPFLDPATEFEGQLKQQIETADVLLICWSSEALHSDYMQKEIEHARSNEKLVLACTLDNVRPENDPMQIPSLKNWHGGLRAREIDQLALAAARRVGSQRPDLAKRIQENIDRHSQFRRWAMMWYGLTIVSSWYALSMWIASQTDGGGPNWMLIDNRPVQGSLIAIVVVNILGILAHRLLRSFALRQQGEHFVRRIPRIGFTAPDPDDGSSRFRAFLMLFFAVVLPLLSLVHFVRKCLVHGKVALCDEVSVVQANAWAAPASWQEFIGHTHCFGQGYEDAAKDGIAFYPLVEPILLGALVLWCFVESIRAMYAVLRLPA